MEIQHLRASFDVGYHSKQTEDEFSKEVSAAGLYDWLAPADRETATKDAWKKIQDALPKKENTKPPKEEKK